MRAKPSRKAQPPDVGRPPNQQPVAGKFREVVEPDADQLVRLESERLSRELETPKKYWLNTVQLHIANRQLQGAELRVAEHAHWVLREAWDKAANWNRREEGKLAPIELPDANDAHYARPEPLYADNLPPAQVLACIAASLLPKPGDLADDKAILRAAEIFAPSERYAASLPKKPQSGPEDYRAAFSNACSQVTAGEIYRSNKTDSGRLPLLPPLGQRRKSLDASEITGAQTEDAIRKALFKHLEASLPNESRAEFDNRRQEEEKLPLFRCCPSPTFQQLQDARQEQFGDLQRRDRIQVAIVAKCRWERFRKHAEAQLHRKMKTAKARGKKTKRRVTAAQSREPVKKFSGSQHPTSGR